MPSNPEGDSQFISKENLSVEETREVLYFNKKTGQVELKTRQVQTQVEYQDDATRGTVISNPFFKQPSEPKQTKGSAKPKKVNA